MPWQANPGGFTVWAMNPTRRAIARRLIQLREEQGAEGRPMTQEAAAAQAGVKIREWQRWEAAEVTPRDHALERIASAFKFDPGEFRSVTPRSRLVELEDRLTAVERHIAQMVEVLKKRPPRAGRGQPRQDDALRQLEDYALSVQAEPREPQRRPGRADPASI